MQMLAHDEIHKPQPLPPGFTARLAAEPWDAALRAADAGEGPGTVFCRFGGTLQAAVILAPDRPVADRAVLQLGTLAVLDALVAAAPPETGVNAALGTVSVNCGEVAALRLARGPDLPDGAPAWLVLGCTIRVALRLDAPGLTPLLTDLAEEGIDIVGEDLLDAVCRHLLASVDLWHEQGEAGIDHAWRAVAA